MVYIRIGQLPCWAVTCNKEILVEHADPSAFPDDGDDGGDGDCEAGGWTVR